MKKQSLSFASWVRAASTIMILLCHFFQQAHHGYGTVLAQFLNIGVHLFFILSGFLAGYQGVTKPYAPWYRKKLQRIYVPFWLFLLVLAIVHLIKGLNVLTPDWLMLVLGLQGSQVGVWGAGQTWFISVILLCYLITPVISEIVSRFENTPCRAAGMGCLLLVFCAPVVYALAQEPWVYTVLTPTSFFALAFLAGHRYDPDKPVPRYTAVVCGCIVIAAFSLRLMVRALFDGSILYDRIIVPYSQFFAAGAIFCLFAVLFGNRRVPRPVKFICDISFEIYLYHYMFTDGPLSLFGKTPSWATDCITVALVAILISFCCNKLAKSISARYK